jgi:hypothetical protein
MIQSRLWRYLGVAALAVIASLSVNRSVARMETTPGGDAAQPRSEPTLQPEPGVPPTTSSAPAAAALSTGPASIAGSAVSTADCYAAGKTRVTCFAVYNSSPDGEWLDRVRLTFPTQEGPWAVTCHSQDAADSSGAPVHMACSAAGNEIVFSDADADAIGEISAGSSWGFCASVTVPGAYNGPRLIPWGLSGDEDGAAPHEETGVLSIEQCMPLMLRPAAVQVQGCNGLPQAIEFELWNDTGSSGTFALAYEVPSDNGAFGGPGSFTLGAGEVVTWTASLEPELCLAAGEVVTARLSASGNGQQDSSIVVHTVSANAGWEGKAPSPVPAMDNVVVWAAHADGGLWSIGGYGANGATQRYDPATDQWTVHTPETVITPAIEYPMDGCYGLNDQGHEIVVLFPDTLVTDTLHVYDITADAWSQRPVPAGYPAVGRWGHDVVSLLDVPGANRNECYLSGGSPQVGGGRTRDLWRYDPASNVSVYLGAFPADIWFGFHASWFVPWIGDEGAICIGGGIDHNSKSDVAAATQCYDLKTGQFRAANADLGPLPEPWWGMADGWAVHDGRYQIWIANGVNRNGALIQASAYADETTGGFVYGPQPPVALYRLEGAGWDGQFLAEQGAAGSFSYSAHNHLLARCPTCYQNYVPAALRNYGAASNATSAK